MALDSEARCAAHPEVSATEVCRRCGGFLCEACARPYGRNWLCPTCAVRQALAPEVSRLAWVAFWLGIVGVVGLLVPGVLAWGLAEWELRRIARGTAPPGGRTYALAARVIGLLCVGMMGLYILNALYWSATH